MKTSSFRIAGPLPGAGSVARWLQDALGAVVPEVEPAEAGEREPPPLSFERLCQEPP